MNSVNLITSIITHGFISLLRSVLLPDQINTGENRDTRQTLIGQAVCIEAAVAFTLAVYIAWICIRGWFFKEPFITSDNLLMGSILVLVAALGTRLLWIFWSVVDSRPRH